MNDDRNLFLVLECQIRFYAVDPATGNALNRVWMGGCAENIKLLWKPKDRVVQRAGIPYTSIYQEDEEYSFTIKNLWIEDLSKSVPAMPHTLRNGRYIVVMVWLDEETGAWVKRSYYGVTCSECEVDNTLDSDFQTLKFRAEQMFGIAGQVVDGSAPPNLDPTQYGTVRYVDGDNWFVTHIYDYGARLFALLDETVASYASIVNSDPSLPDKCVVSIGGVTAMIVDNTGIRVKQLVAMGSTITDDPSPRLEFYVGATRIAALTQTGTLIVPNVTEQPANPGLAQDFELTIPDWFASLASGMAYASNFQEVSSLT